MNLSLVGLTLHVKDVEKSFAFYRQFPGAEVMFHLPGIFALLKMGNGRLGLLCDQKRPFHVEIDCLDLDATYALFQELGIPTEGPPSVKPWGERDFLLLDPDGNLVECGQQKGARQ
jgi:catechol 2,3-dioxygenase-like lactoylglutathione lyase family enzyme